MPEDVTQAGSEHDSAVELRAHAEALQRQLAEIEQEARARIMHAELKVEAVRAGIIDLDGLKLLDLKDARLAADGNPTNAAELVAQLRRAKPWLFASPSSSSPASVPPAQTPRQKLATEMSDAEYRAARAAILKHRS